MYQEIKLIAILTIDCNKATVKEVTDSRPPGNLANDIFFAKITVMGNKPKTVQIKLLAKNKKAYFDYEVLEKYETGIILTGPEVKSIKGGHVQLKGSFAAILAGRVLIQNMHVSHYKCSPITDYNPLRKRELLLQRKEIDYLTGMSLQKGYTLIPLEIFLKNNFIKILLGVCRGKQAHDKRNVLKKRAIEKELRQGCPAKAWH